MCDVTHHNSFGSGLTDVTKVRKRIVYILDEIFVLFYQGLYNIPCLMLSFRSPTGFW